MQDDPTTRSQRFAKLLDYQGKQVLVALARNSDDDMRITVTMWSGIADMQVVALMDLGDDDRALVAFDTLDQTNIAAFIEATPLGELVGG